MMNTRRAPLRSVIRLGFVLSATAVALAFVLDSLGGVSPAFLVAAVAATGFTTSWILAGRELHAEPIRVARIGAR